MTDKPHRARNRFGQNFLTDPGIIQRIASAINAREGDNVVEIGPGTGALTTELLASNCQLQAIELDRDLLPRLQQAFGQHDNFTLHSGDALAFDFTALTDQAHALRVVGNLPYNISTPLIFKLMESSDLIADMHFMLQLEVVNRLAAKPGSKAWGRLGIMAQFHCQIDALFEVPPTAFSPPPKVHSAIVRLLPHRENPYPGADKKALEKLVRAAFSQRRKTLRNNLKGLLNDEQLMARDIDPGARAETLSLAQFVNLSEELR